MYINYAWGPVILSIGPTIDGSLGGDVNSTSLLELDSDGDGDTPT